MPPASAASSRPRQCRLRRIIQRQHAVGQQSPDRVDVDARVAHQQIRVHLVERVVGRVPPPAEAGTLARRAAEYRPHHVVVRACRLLAHGHEQRRDADAPERLVAGAAHAVPVERLPALLAHRLRSERAQLRRRQRIRQHRVALGAGAVHVDVSDATTRQFGPMRVGIPGRARIAPVRVARPETEAQSAPPLRALGREQPRHFQHRRVGAAIVHHAEIPGVVVAGEHHERRLIGGLCGRQLGHQQRRAPPAGIDLGVERHLHRFAIAHAAAQCGAILLPDAQHDGARQALARRLGGAAPHRRDAHLVQVPVRADVDLPDRAGL